jgi:hypothetical protein
MRSRSKLPDGDDIPGFHGLLLLLRALFVEAAQLQHEAGNCAAIPLGELDSKARRQTVDALRSLQRRGFLTRELQRGFAFVKLTPKGRKNCESMASYMFGVNWRELDLGRYLYAGFQRTECSVCGAIFYHRGRPRTWCGKECEATLHNLRSRRSRMNSRRRRVDIPDPVAAAFDLKHADELSPLAEAILYAEQAPPLFERECRKCGRFFVGTTNAGYCSGDCFVEARRYRQGVARQKKREAVLA